MGKNRILTLTIVLALVLSFFSVILILSGRLDKDPVVEITADNCYQETLHVVTDQDYRPYSFSDSDGNFSGHDVELVTMLANRMHMNLDLKFMQWDEGIRTTLDDRSQVLMTCDFSDSFNGTDSLLKTDAISYDDFIVFSKRHVSSVNDLYGKRIGIMSNGNVIPLIEKLNLMQYCTAYPDNREAMKALIDGKVDCAVMRNAVGTVLIGGLMAEGIVQGYLSIGQSFMCFGVNNSHPELLERLNKAILETKTDGSLSKLGDKWLTSFVAPYSLKETLSNNIGLVTGFFLLFLIISVTFYVNEKHKNRSIQERNHFQKIVENLSNDFECVISVPVADNGRCESSMLIRLSDTLMRNIPEWAKELDFAKRLEILCNSIVAPEDRNRFMKETAMDVILNNLSDVFAYYVNFQAVIDGRPKFYQMKFSAIRDSQTQQIQSLVCGMHDVDDKTKTYMKTKTDLEQSNKAKTDFLFNMSHDIRTPMNAIIGFTHLAKKHISDSGRVIDCLNKIESSGNHLLDLINEILDMSRVEAGKIKCELKDTNVTDAVNRLITIFRETAEKNGISLTLKNCRITHNVVAADELHINQILMNIVGNAIKYTLPGGSVSVEISESESAHEGCADYKYVIEDTGIGMSKEFVGKIFDSFSREENQLVNGIQGTGLGMSIVKRLVELMDGTISVESEQDKGTKVTVILPLFISKELEVLPVEDNDSYIDLEGKRILLVEDNDLNREIANCLLTDSGVIVEEAKDGLEAVECIKGKDPDYYDCVLMDIQMPVMNGYEATVEIRKLKGYDQLIIIALSANAFEEDRAKSLDAGMNDHLAKPINPAELKETLAMYM